MYNYDENGDVYMMRMVMCITMMRMVMCITMMRMLII